MDWTIIGLLAGALTTIGFLPQVYRGYKTKSLADLSYPMLIILTCGLLIWLIYGIHFNDVPIIVANVVSAPCTMLLIAMKFRYSKKGKKLRLKYHNRILCE